MKYSSSRGNRWGSVWAHAVLVSIVAICYFIYQSPAVTLYLGGTLSFLTFGAMAVREGRRAPLWVTPLSAYFLLYSVSLGLSVIYAASMVVSGHMLYFAAATVSPDEFTVGYILYLAGSLALHTGVQLLRPYGPVSASRWPDLGVSPTGWLAFLWGIGITALLFPRWFHALGILAGLLPFASYAALAVLALTPRERLGLSRFGFVAILSACTAVQVFAALNSNSKAYILWALIPMGWFVLKSKLDRRWIVAGVITLLLLYTGLIAPVVNSSRNLPGGTPPERMLHAIRYANVVQLNSLNVDSFWKQAEQALYRLLDPLPVGFIVGEVREGWEPGNSLTDDFFPSLVPRLLWPDKPVVTRGAWFKAYVGDKFGVTRTGGSLGLSAIGDLYWHLGFFGMMGGMLAMGACIGVLWRRAGTDPGQKPLHMLLYLILMLTLGPASAEALSAFVAMVALFLLFAIGPALIRPGFAPGRRERDYSPSLAS